jgi:hypothetical protein
MLSKELGVAQKLCKVQGAITLLGKLKITRKLSKGAFFYNAIEGRSDHNTDEKLEQGSGGYN